MYVKQFLQVWSGLYEADQMSTTTRIKDHQQHKCLEQLDKSAMAELSINREHHTILQDTNILSTKSKHTIPIFMVKVKDSCNRPRWPKGFRVG
jgi:hypothetical protein